MLTFWSIHFTNVKTNGSQNAVVFTFELVELLEQSNDNLIIIL